ncbi:MAG: XdhC family protein [Methylococcales bacterium]|nr:XdhC family protein [Methylococcales bacterium]
MSHTVYIVVLDERADLHTFKNNHDADKKITCSYHDVHTHILEKSRNYVVIVTPNHRTDEIVLKQLLEKKLSYLGLMGSPAKIKRIFTTLKQAGISPEKLSQLQIPIGLPIRSHTPTEIAISIAAEIILFKNKVN